MGIQNAYACDGPKCDALTKKDKGERKPSHWVQITVTDPANGEKTSGAFHSESCAQAWVANELGVTPPLEKADVR